MITDFFAKYPAMTRDEVERIGELPMAESSKIALLAQTLDAPKDVKEAGRVRYERIVRERLGMEIERDLTLLRQLGLDTPNTMNVLQFGEGACYLALNIRLEKPFLSRDDAPFHVNDNPVKKDKVFRVPMVSPTTWKGHMRNAAEALLFEGKLQKSVIRRLFGNEKGVTDESKTLQGRLRFFPTFFDRIGFEIINPHDRATRVGKNPIQMECAPRGARGRFGVLYVPFPANGREGDVAESDHRAMVRLAAAVLGTYGFSAKKSSGYGVVEAKSATGRLIRGSGETAVGSLEALISFGEGH